MRGSIVVAGALCCFSGWLSACQSQSPKPEPVSSVRSGPLEIGLLGVEGPRDGGPVRQTLAGHLDEAQACFAAEAKADPTLSGEVMVRFSIDEQGKVLDAVVGKSNLPTTRVGACLIKAAKTWAFPAAPGNAVTVINVPFRYHPG